MFGHEGLGLGNYLISYAASYYFAILSGRDVVIYTHSLLGEFCRMVKCGFPLSHEVLPSEYPAGISKEDKKIVRAIDYIRHYSGTEVIDAKYGQVFGYRHLTFWLNEETEYKAEIAKCITQTTACDMKDTYCLDRYALQRLIQGPFKLSTVVRLLRRLSGVSTEFAQSFLTLPHSLAPRIDVAVHFRTIFSHFESNIASSDARAQSEVQQWLHSTDPDKGEQLYREMERKLIDLALKEDYGAGGGTVSGSSGSGRGGGGCLARGCILSDDRLHAAGSSRFVPLDTPAGGIHEAMSEGVSYAMKQVRMYNICTLMCS